MKSLYIYALLIIVLIGFIKWYSDKEREAGYNQCQVESVKKIKDAVQAALEKERKQQALIAKGLQEQYNEVNRINNRLNRDLDRLRNRTSRAGLSKAKQVNCKGVTGSELSKEDGSFLTREAAAANKIKTALKACYNYADSLQ